MNNWVIWLKQVVGVIGRANALVSQPSKRLGQTQGIVASPLPERKPRRKHGDAGGKCRKTPVFGQRVWSLKAGLNIYNNIRSQQAHATQHLHTLDRLGVSASWRSSRRCQTHQRALDYGAGHG